MEIRTIRQKIPMLPNVFRATVLAALVSNLAACHDSSFVISGSTRTPAFGTLPAAATLYDLSAMGRAMVIYNPPVPADLLNQGYRSNLHVSNFTNDLNGDNVDDLIFAQTLTKSGLPSFTNNYIFYGPANWEISLDLADLNATRPNTTITGQLLIPVSTLTGNDYNNDGMPDLFASDVAAPGSPLGEGYIFFGGSFAPTSTDSDPYFADVIMLGEVGINFASLLGSRDINGDSIPDLLMNRPHGGAREIGIFYGGPHLGTEIDPAQSPPDVRITYAEFSPNVYIRVLDLNADGFNDIVFLTRETFRTARAGEVPAVLAFFGGPGLPNLIRASSESDVAIYGQTEDVDETTIADINGDGIQDILFNYGRQSIHAVFGGNGISSRLNLDTDATDLTIAGLGPLEGFDELFVLDFNDDGIDDLAFEIRGSDGPNGNRESAGAIKIIMGEVGLAGFYDLAHTSTAVTIHGADSGDSLRLPGAIFFSEPDVQIGDFNGDGIDDLVFSAFGDGPENNTLSAGEIYIAYGSRTYSNDTPFEIDLAVTPADALIYGSSLLDHFGVRYSLGVGDFNHDGVDDLAIPVPSGDGPDEMRTDAGELYIIFGGADVD